MDTIDSTQQHQYSGKLPATYGQAVVEYAGALAIAAVVVVGLIAANMPTGISTAFSAVVAAAAAYLQGLWPA